MNDNLMLEIQRVSFVMDELRLYIDTHPDNSEALAMFNECCKKRKELLEKYNKEVGPMGGYCCEETGVWRWGDNVAWKGGNN